MLPRRTLALLPLLGPLAAGSAAPAVAQPAPPPGLAEARAFLDGIYRQYQGANATGPRLSSAADRRRYFTTDLAAAMQRDAERSARRREVGALDGDPFLDAQDWDIAGVEIALPEVLADPLVAIVTLPQRATIIDDARDRSVTIGRPPPPPLVLRVTLARQRDGWRIRDVSREGDSLRRTLGLRP